MKKLIVFGIAMILSFSLPLMAFAQSISPDVAAVDIFNLQAYFVSIAAMAGVILPVTSFVNKLFKLTGAWKQVLSWAVAVGLGVLAWLLKWGIMADVDWYWMLLYSALAGLVANGLFDIPAIKIILQLLKLEVKVE
nr:hypothetical protein [uncultured Carboxylicivirga sp.]